MPGIKIAAIETRVTTRKCQIVLCRSDLVALLGEAGVSVPSDCSISVDGIPHETEWEVEDQGRDGVHVVVSFVEEDAEEPRVVELSARQSRSS